MKQFFYLNKAAPKILQPQMLAVSYHPLQYWIFLLDITTISQTGEDNAKKGDRAANFFLHMFMVGLLANQKAYIQPLLHLKNLALARDSMKFTSICRDTLYIDLYRSCTLAYWGEKDDKPKDPKRIVGRVSTGYEKNIQSSPTN